MRWIACLLAAASVLSVAGCASSTKTLAPSGSHSASAQAAQHDVLDPQGNVVLYVTNQSFAAERVDIAIEVDGQPVFNQYFNVGSQHTYKQFILSLTPGQHLLTALSIEGRATLKTSFFVRGKRWIAGAYSYYTQAQGTPMARQLDFRVQDTPMVFE